VRPTGLEPVTKRL